jgi:chloride channel protein, CIC family
MATSFTSPRRLLLLTALAAVLGVAGGGAAWVLLHLIGLITNLALFQRVAWSAPSFRTLHASPVIPLAAVAGAFVVSLLARWAPMIRGHGIPEAMEAVLVRQSRIAPRAAIAKPLSAAIAIGTGGPFGAEGPIIVTGGSVGSLLGQVLRVSPAERKILLASGAAAGMAATFGAPLAAVVLAIELLLFEFSTRAFVPLVVSSAVAAAMHNALFGAGPLFAVPAHHVGGLDQLPAFAVLGVACGLLAIVLTKGLFFFEAGFRRLPVPEAWHPVVGALGFAAVGLAVPRALGVGYDAIGDVLNSRIALGTIALLAAAKLVAWWVALASGTSGGTLAPILLVSAGFGTLVASGVNEVFPGLGISPGLFALVAMAAVFGSATGASFTGIVFVFELTRDYKVIVGLMIATVLADLLVESVLPENIMTEKLARRGLRVSGNYHVDFLGTVPVRQIMTRTVETIPSTASCEAVRAKFASNGHGAYPIVDGDARCIGVVARGDLLREDVADDDAVVDHASRDVVSVGPEEPAVTAVHRMLEEGVEHVPVLVDDRIVGIVTRTDVLRVRQEQLRHERLEDGRLPVRAITRRISRPRVPRRGSHAEGAQQGPHAT